MITEKQYKKALKIISQYRKESIVDESSVRFKCSCGNHYFTHVDPSQIKNRYGGTKHYYSCDNCSLNWWSFFYRLDTENYKK